MAKPTPDVRPDDWHCACVRRWPDGRLRSIRRHRAPEPKCDDCGADQPKKKPIATDPLHGEQPREGGGDATD